MEQKALIELPTNQLLDKFGAGVHKPGSGSAAALMGILSAKLIITVCKLSLKKSSLKKHHRQLRLVQEQIEDVIEPKLQEFFQKDSEVFDAVIKERVKRDKAKTDKSKKEHRNEELKHLREATEIPLQIGHECLQLIDLGSFVFDSGFQSARGDSGAAVSAAIAGVTAGVFVAHLNMKSFGASQWKSLVTKECDTLLESLKKKQEDAFSRITQLSEEEIRTMDIDFA